MPKIKNWTRKERHEDVQQVFVWMHDSKPYSAKVMKRANKEYEILVKNRDNNIVLFNRLGYSSRETARVRLVEWLKDNSNP